MNEQTACGSRQQANGEATRQLWVTPTFERIELKKALSGSSGSNYDGFSEYGS